MDASIAYRARDYKIVNYNGWSTAPHSLTERASYTVPAHSWGLIQSIFLHAYRDAAASSVGTAILSVKITPSGGSEVPIIYTILRNNNVGEFTQVELAEGILLKGGDTIKIYTQDSSTGGNVSYLATIYIVEFM